MLDPKKKEAADSDEEIDPLGYQDDEDDDDDDWEEPEEDEEEEEIDLDAE